MQLKDDRAGEWRICMEIVKEPLQYSESRSNLCIMIYIHQLKVLQTERNDDRRKEGRQTDTQTDRKVDGRKRDRNKGRQTERKTHRKKRRQKERW
jgi:hypothetical protein